LSRKFVACSWFCTARNAKNSRLILKRRAKTLHGDKSTRFPVLQKNVVVSIHFFTHVLKNTGSFSLTTTFYIIHKFHNSFIHHHTLAFPLGRVAGSTALAGLEITHSFQQPLLVPLAPFQDGTKQGRRWNHTIWSLVGHWTALS